MRRIATTLLLGLVLSITPGLASAEGPTVRIVDSQATDAATAAASSGYVIRSGDSLSGIAVRFGVSLSSVMRSNGIRNPDRIYSGQRLVIPSTGGAVSTPAPTAGPSTASSQSNTASGSASPDSGKTIYISIGKQRLFAYQDGRQVYSMIASSGLPGQATATGNFRVKTKLPEAFASLWSLRMPYWMGIYDVGSYENGIHALPINKWGQTMWGGLLGRPASFGCIVIGTYDASVLYNWAPMGTPVIIRY